MSKLLSFTPEAHKLKNNDGYNPLHMAVQNRNKSMVKCILGENNFDINMRVGNGETALHMAAQLFQTDILRDLIRRGGDLSLQDQEDYHTPLHDCLQQVYFEGGHEEGKFITVWNVVLEEAITWWHSKMEPAKTESEEESENESEEESENDSIEESEKELQWKAVYYLRSCIRNDHGLSALQYAADRGLVKCVQTMLSAKNIFVVQEAQDNSENAKQNFDIDVTNLCPEYVVEKKRLYRKAELQILESSNSSNRPNPMRENHEETSNVDEDTGKERTSRQENVSHEEIEMSECTSRSALHEEKDMKNLVTLK